MADTLSKILISQWEHLTVVRGKGATAIRLDGANLALSHVIAVARYGASSEIELGADQRLQASLDALHTRLNTGDVIYGVNTGFGGSADARTQDAVELQRVLIRELHYGILKPCVRDPKRYQSVPHSLCDDEGDFLHLPKSWTRGAILVRINSLIKGCSAVRPIVVERMSDLIRLDIIPVVPLRGSISASGDLSPLSYIGGAIQGKPTIRIHTSSAEQLHADEAFIRANVLPVRLGPKEGLAVVNGTAISTASAALALHDAFILLALSQIATAMSVEALLGTAESFDPFFSEMRPHPGQVEVANNIDAFLRDSCMIEANTGAEFALRQDRYAIRTAPQWIGPVIEDMRLAYQQIMTECNSATDNPLASERGMLHGGNFQAKAVSSAMEKVKQGNCAIGRMLFSQCAEIINPATSRGLPPNLVAEDPGSSFIFKGTDINLAALQAELGFLATPVNHVQTAEMGNQSLNSLALIVARYTHTSNQVLAQMAAGHLIAVCQALDLRAMKATFFNDYKSTFETLIQELLGSDGHVNERIQEGLWKQVRKSFDDTASLNTTQRFKVIATALKAAVIEEPKIRELDHPIRRIETITSVLTESLEDAWCAHRDFYMRHGKATPYIGRGSKQMYGFIRERVGIPFLFSECIRTPEIGEYGHGAQKAPTVGSYTSILYKAIRDGSILDIILPILRDAQE